MSNTSMKVQYSGSVFWLIFWAIIFFPVALVLLMTGGTFTKDGSISSIQYDGSRNWLCFWTLICFPIAIILVLINGFSIETRGAISEAR